MHSGLKRFLGDMDLPAPINATAYNRTLINISSVSVKLAEQQMKEAADRLKKLVLDEEPENIELSPAGDMIAQVAVSVDGTWQRTSHCSKIGVVFVQVRLSTTLLKVYVVILAAAKKIKVQVNMDSGTRNTKQHVKLIILVVQIVWKKLVLLKYF